MARVLFILAVLAGLSGIILGVKAQKTLRYETLPPSLGYADTISEGIGAN